MWELDHKQGRTCKNWCFWTVVLQKTLESHSRFLRVTWKSRRSNQSILKEIILFGRTEAPILWPPDANNRLIGKDPDTGKDWRQKKTAAEYEMLGWHYWLNGHELGQTGRWWRTGKPGMLQSIGSWRVRHDLVTDNINSIKNEFLNRCFIFLR